MGLPATMTQVQRASGGNDGFRLRIGVGADAAGIARRELSRLRTDLDPPLLENMRLLVTEMVTTSVRHEHAGELELSVLVGRERVRVEIANPGSPLESELREDDAGADTGWGLFLIDHLSDAWGVVEDEDTGSQRVWFELRRT